MYYNVVIILASSRPDGDTRKLVDSLFSNGTVEVVDLLDYNIYPYSYTGKYPADDQFLQLIQRIQLYSKIVFATPVYWYALSGLMKTFFDRHTDIVTVLKILGRQMAGKQTFLLAVGAEAELPAGFEVPFELTSAYFDMRYIASYYCSKDAVRAVSESRKAFLQKVNLKLKSNE